MLGDFEFFSGLETLRVLSLHCINENWKYQGIEDWIYAGVS